MPTIIILGYKFRFYSSDGVEPPHVHVLRDDKEAKVWIDPIALQHNRGYNQHELREILRLCAQNQRRLVEAWNVYFSQH